MGVGGGVALLQQLCVVQEALAQPFRRGCQVGGVVLELPRAALPLVSVDPMAGHGGGVEGLKRKRKRAAAEDRLFNVTDFLWPVVLVEFLKVENPEIPERHGQGFQLTGVVQAEELDCLPGRDVCQGQGLAGLLPQVSDAHAVDHPVVFGPYGGGQGTANLPQNNPVNVGDAHDQQKVLGCCKGALEAASPAVAQVFVVIPGPDGGMGPVIFRYDQAAQAEPSLLQQLRWPLRAVCHPQIPPFRRIPSIRGVPTNARGLGFSRRSTWLQGRPFGPS